MQNSVANASFMAQITSSAQLALRVCTSTSSRPVFIAASFIMVRRKASNELWCQSGGFEFTFSISFEGLACLRHSLFCEMIQGK
jgi:hypothetical protein